MKCLNTQPLSKGQFAVFIDISCFLVGEDLGNLM